MPHQRSSIHIFRQIALIIFLVYSPLSALHVCAQTKVEDEKSRQVKEALAEIVKQEKIPGIIAAITDSNGVLAIGSAGVRKAGTVEEVTDDDLFHIGSCTKAMTSTLLARFVDEGAISWETTLIEIFPEYKTKIHPAYHQITLWQLVTHRAGFPANAKSWWNHRNKKITARRQFIMLENLKEAPTGKPGQFLYSNLGYMVAGCMAEKLSKTTWEVLMKDYLFDPLEMHSAGFGPPGKRNQTDQPWGHAKEGGQWQAKQFDNAEALGPAGRVHCSVEDWAKFIALQLPAKRTPILDSKSLGKLITPTEGEYAAGWKVVERSWANGVTLTHSGSNTMWKAVVWVAPELNRAFIVATNSKDDNSSAICDKMIGKLIAIDKME